jgi:hypothetical protein
MENKELLEDLLKGLSVLPIDLIILSKEKF